MTEKDKRGYAIGMSVGMNMKKQHVDATAELLAAGLKDAFAGTGTLLTEEEMVQILTAYQQEMQMKQMAEQAAIAAAQVKKSALFMEENGKKEGVKTLPSGLQYKVLTAGTGQSPAADSTVEVHYQGQLVDGTEFDSSYLRGEPATFPVNGVISGWTEALQLMKEGAKWQLAIPAALAYGERGFPPAIPPASALIFEVELLKIVE
ncbi:MAG: hypothetical protein GQ578_02315 [Desulfuromonadaceae bacterium]|nr:hypothetical protein [Desulfuromonadaceae bacterium]